MEKCVWRLLNPGYQIQVEKWEMESKGPLWDRGVCRVEETIQGDEEAV